MTEVRDINIEVSVKRWMDREGESLMNTLFSRTFRISLDFPLSLQEPVFREFLHERLDKIINELVSHMEAVK